MAGSPAGWRRWLPGLAVLTGYQRDWLRGDLLAGITVAAYLVPQVMAYAAVAGLPPVLGLWASLGPLLIYALVGTSRQLSVGPESTSALMTAAGLAALAGAAGPGHQGEVASLLAVSVGLICVLGWLGRLGFLSELLSKPVLTGYLSGMAILMMVSQLGKITRIRTEGDSPVRQLSSLVANAGQLHLPTLMLGAAVLATVGVLTWWRPHWPSTLLVIVAATAVSTLLQLPSDGLVVVGPIPQGLPAPGWPALGGVQIAELLPAAVGIALVGYSDNMLTGRAFADRHQQRIDANQEFLALGLANMASGLSHGFPVSSSGSRTVLGDLMGAKSQAYSVVVALGVAATLLWLGPVLSAFPVAALAAVVIHAAIHLIDGPQWRRIARFRRSELALAGLTTIAVLGLGVLAGIGVAITLSVLDLLRRLANPHDGVLGIVPELAGMHDIDDYPQAQELPGLLVYRYDSPLFFANADNFTRRALQAIDDHPGEVQWFLLNAEANVEVDLTAMDALDTLREQLADRGITFALARVKRDLFDQLDAAGLVKRIGRDHIFPTLPTAVQAFLDEQGRMGGQSGIDRT